MEGNVQVPQASRTNIRVTAETGSKELIVKASSDFFHADTFYYGHSELRSRIIVVDAKREKLLCRGGQRPCIAYFFGIVS